MLYTKKDQPFSMKDFENPGSEYRGAPFWAWNTRLDSDTISRQVEVLHEMGFGGFHAHVRTGLDTPYMTPEFLGYMKQCCALAKEKQMLLWLYDEDRGPSGAAGGAVTKDLRFCERLLRMSPTPRPELEKNRAAFLEKCGRGEEVTGCLLGRYRIHLQDGLLCGYTRLPEDAPDEEGLWYATLEISPKSAWFNNQSYVNTLDKRAIDRFIQLTHDVYADALGAEFGKTIPAIFTDEPQFKTKETFYYAEERRDVILPFTDDLPETFRAAYGYDLLDCLPEIFWNKAEYSQVRYHYHDHICARFVEAFPKNIGGWCGRRHLALTGHVNAEPTLTSQTYSVGAAMRCYPYFQLPGIDMLCDWHEFATAKQAQSIVHQYGREGMLSELYGVTNWDFDFKGHKLHGDWQAALGVTVRVPHLAWMSMEGEAKRDYPASIFYQSPWYREYPLIENHFARLNTVLTRGACRVRVGVIHPIESFWLLCGPQQQSHDLTEQAEKDFDHLIRWLLFGLIDFDFIDESLLPELTGEEVSAPLSVGKMNYDVVILPPMLTVRQSTLDILTRFVRAGGDVIAFGDTPQLVGACRSSAAAELYGMARHSMFDRYHLLHALEAYREVDILNSRGFRTDHLLHQLRRDGGEEWLFICHVYRKRNGYEQPEQIRIRIRGCLTPTLYDTLTGGTRSVEYHHDGGWTVIDHVFYSEDSLLLRLTPAEPGTADERCGVPAVLSVFPPESEWQELPEPDAFHPSEPNVLLLDMAEYSLNGEPMRPREELLRIDNAIRERLGYPRRMDQVAQPYTITERPEAHDELTLRFHIESRLVLTGVKLGIERKDVRRITLNGAPVALEPDGYFTDECISTIPLPEIRSGSNELIVTLGFNEKTNVEWCYLLGAFGVLTQGRASVLTPMPESLVYGDVTRQLLPFYGANLTYETELTADGEHSVTLFVPRFSGPLLRVSVDGEDRGVIAFAPHTLELGRLSAGKHRVCLRLYGNRANSFACLHNTNSEMIWFGPTCWRTEGNEWAYQYTLKPFGILQNPRIHLHD